MAPTPVLIGVTLKEIVYHWNKATKWNPYIGVSFDPATWPKLYGLDSSHPIIRVGEAQTAKLPDPLKQLLQKVKATKPHKFLSGGSVASPHYGGLPQYLPSNWDAYNKVWPSYDKYKSASAMYNSSTGVEMLFGIPVVEDATLPENSVCFMAHKTHIHTIIIKPSALVMDQLGEGLNASKVFTDPVTEIRVHPKVALLIKSETASDVTKYVDDGKWAEIGTTDEGMQGVTPVAYIKDEIYNFPVTTSSSASVTYTLNDVPPETLKYLTGGKVGGPVSGDPTKDVVPPYLHSVHPVLPLQKGKSTVSKMLEENVEQAMQAYNETSEKEQKAKGLTSQEYLDGYPYKWSSPDSNPYQDIIDAQAVGALHAQPPGYELQIHDYSKQGKSYTNSTKKVVKDYADGAKIVIESMDELGQAVKSAEVNSVALTEQLKKLMFGG